MLEPKYSSLIQDMFGTLRLIYQSFWEYKQEVINVKQLINLNMQPTDRHTEC